MKKCGSMLMLLSLPLILSGCNHDPIDSNSQQNSSDSTNSSNSNAGKSDSSNESGSSGSISSSSIDYTIGWSEEVLDVMVSHLGGQAIPFIDLPGKIVATWVEASHSYYSDDEEAHLSIFSTGAFDRALLGDAKMTYQKAGWDVSFDGSGLKMHAEELNRGIQLDFYGVIDPNDGMSNPQIDVYYDEPFVIPTNWQWRNSTIDVLASIGVENPHMLPYAYLGTLAEEATLYTSQANTVEIKGRAGAWTTYENQIISAVRSSFPKNKKWSETTETITAGSGYYYYDTYTGHAFTRTFSDGYKLKAVLYGYEEYDYSTYSYVSTPILRVTCTAPAA